MKRLIFLFAFFLIGMMVFATAPKKVELKLNKNTGVLEVTVIHKVKDVEKHYIDEIIVEVNGEQVAVKNPEKQTDVQQETIEFVVENLKPGDEIKVSAKCNQFGKKSAKLTVE